MIPPREPGARTGCNEPKRRSTRFRSMPQRPVRMAGSTPQVAHGRKARGARAVDLMIAAVAAATGLPLCTRNPDDFAGLGDLVTVVAL